MRAATQHQIQLGGYRIKYRVVRSRTARKLRIRVGPNGVEVLQPVARNTEDVSTFLSSNEAWILDQLRRVERLRGVRRPEQCQMGEILFRGVPTKVRVEIAHTRARGNVVEPRSDEIVVWQGAGSRTPVSRSLENWLRRRARTEIEKCLAVVTARLRQTPNRVYVMGQRTKWGNCSRRRNLSFNWRLILAPEFVLRYLVTHEAVHLAIPDHSAKFWLTVQSFCPELQRARQWLSTNQPQLLTSLSGAVAPLTKFG